MERNGNQLEWEEMRIFKNPFWPSLL